MQQEDQEPSRPTRGQAFCMTIMHSAGLWANRWSWDAIDAGSLPGASVMPAEQQPGRPLPSLCGCSQLCALSGLDGEELIGEEREQELLWEARALFGVAE